MSAERPRRRCNWHAPSLLAVPLAGTALLLVGGCGETDRNEPTPATAPTAASAAEGGDEQPARRRTRRGHLARAAGTGTTSAMLRRLKLAAESSEAGYSREDFPHWIEQDGCTTRQQVLIAERRAGSERGCAVSGGRWFSVYDGRRLTSAAQIDIDHFVPLQQAYVSGASRWDRATRRRFANDLGYSESLIAVSASSNRAKGAQDPAQWLPPRAAYRCRYVGTWIAVKYRWRLAVDRAERKTLRAELRRCGSRADVPRPARAAVG